MKKLFRKSIYVFQKYYYGFIVNKRPWIVRTGLPVKCWYDTDERMLHANMNLLVEFVEKEKGL